MGKRIHAKSGLLDEEDTENTGVNAATLPVSPSNAGNKSWEYQPHKEDNLQVIPVLPDHNRVFVEVADVGSADSLGILLHDHPANVTIQEPFANAVGVLLGVCVSVMSSVVAAPPADRSLNGTATHGSEEKFEYGFS